ncbi:MAG: DNA mismatch repair protein MutS [Rhodospirillaceae bacterium]|nr:DNA mismatch repair protein MutS [Rhodospirillaceae bacterium]
MLAQYFEIKREHPDALLFYRMGDFYELFFDDAVDAAGALDITLTKRGRHNDDPIPMCGVPFHAADTYLSRLIRKGFRVAICDQIEDPAEARKRGSKSVVKRAVTRVVTPGTVTEDTLLEARSNNYLAGLAAIRGELGLAWVDVSTGALQMQPITEANVGAALARISPSELLLPDRMLDGSLADSAVEVVIADWRSKLVPLPSSRFDSTNGTRRLESLFNVSALDGFGNFSRAELAAAGALVDYLELTQKGKIPKLSAPKRWRTGGVVEIDPATRANLELTRTLLGERRGSLLDVIDQTVTGAGARLLAERLSGPPTDPGEIIYRLDKVTHFVDTERLRAEVRAVLKRTPDLERALSRLALDRGGPRDLAAVRDGLGVSGLMRDMLTRFDAQLAVPPAGILAICDDLGHHEKTVDLLTRALVEEPPLLARDGGFIATGHVPELDRFRTLRDESRRLIAGLQARYIEETGIASLKIRHNNVLGYFIEVTAVHVNKAKGKDNFIHRQTMTNATRFTTIELGELERDLGQAADKALALEQENFTKLANEILSKSDAVLLAASALARVDVASSLAELAIDRRYVRPTVEVGLSLEIIAGRHPVVEALTRDGKPFVANDCDLAPEQRLWLVTGPNMAGKSTFLRQNALIVLLSQMGSYVPATAARIGVVDRLFSRVGAADDLARGRSTFMVEMVETAAILNQATEHSLVILDELGRGTATFDGLSIAWAAIEHLHEVNRCRTLFATHFHELTVLASKLSALSCHTMRIKEWKEEIVFLHEVGSGAADRSYGIHVAKLAGLPSVVIDRAEAVLEHLEKGDKASAAGRLADDLPLFQAILTQPTHRMETNVVEQRLIETNPDMLSPLEALELLYELRRMSKR